MRRVCFATSGFNREKWCVASTYTLRCTDSLCLRPSVILPTVTSDSLLVMPGWYIWQKCCAYKQTTVKGQGQISSSGRWLYAIIKDHYMLKIPVPWIYWAYFRWSLPFVIDSQNEKAWQWSSREPEQENSTKHNNQYGHTDLRQICWWFGLEGRNSHQTLHILGVTMNLILSRFTL